MQYSDQLRRRSPTEIGSMALAFVFLSLIVFSSIPEVPHDIVTNYCPQPSSLHKPVLDAAGFLALQNNNEFGFSPVANNKSYGFESSMQFYSEEYSNHSSHALQAVIRIPTMSFDDMAQDPKNDSRFEPLHELHKFLHKTFPLTAEHSENVNTYGLLYTFHGSDPSLKPIVLMAHQDVVPVPEETLDEWDHPPFEAHFDGEFLWGRGTADTKNSVVGILEALESLLRQNWNPLRTVVVSFGFDEEIGGFRGAGELAKELERRYGINGVELVLDEGFGLPRMYNARVGAISVAEKGYLDAVVTSTTPGGHSKAPPDHTSIGIMSELVKRLEDRPFPAELEDSNPTLGLYRCLAEHAPVMSKELRRDVLEIDEGSHREKFVKYISANPLQKYWIRTSQAVDVIDGGFKLNALPEQVVLKVNHRINMNSGTSAIIDRFEDILVSVAEDFGLGVESEGETLSHDSPNGNFKSDIIRTLEPSPIAPHSGFQWNLSSETLASVLGNAPFRDQDEPLVIAPYLFGANTDTRHVWGLTRAIYRFKPVLAEDLVNYHTVNERIRFRSHLMTVAWYYEFILNSTL